jgi:hypothetical protein
MHTDGAQSAGCIPRKSPALVFICTLPHSLFCLGVSHAFFKDKSVRYCTCNEQSAFAFSEIQPLETRAAGAAINVSSNMLFTFIIAQCFTTMLCSMKYGVFLFFAGEPGPSDPFLRLPSEC